MRNESFFYPSSTKAFPFKLKTFPFFTLKSHRASFQPLFLSFLCNFFNLYVCFTFKMHLQHYCAVLEAHKKRKEKNGLMPFTVPNVLGFSLSHIRTLLLCNLKLNKNWFNVKPKVEKSMPSKHYFFLRR